MANKEHLEILECGVDFWNKWKKKSGNLVANLTNTEFESKDFEHFDFSNTDFTSSSFNDSRFLEADFSNSILKETSFLDCHFKKNSFKSAILESSLIVFSTLASCDFLKSDCSYSRILNSKFTKCTFNNTKLDTAFLIENKFTDTEFYNSNLENSNLNGSSFLKCKLSHLSLLKSDFKSAYIIESLLRDCNIVGATFGNTYFSESILENNLNLESTHHNFPSSIDFKTIAYSSNIPIEFLQGCGLTEWEIELSKLFRYELENVIINDVLYRVYDLRANKSIQIAPLFISYSHKDSIFVESLELKLKESGIRVWRDVHEATAGRLETQIDRAIRHNPILLMILSKNSIESDWVQHEAREARNLEKELKRDVLCPIALDDSWKNSNWPKRLREQIEEYNILDFSDWQDGTKFSRKFSLLIDGLDLFYK